MRVISLNKKKHERCLQILLPGKTESKGVVEEPTFLKGKKSHSWLTIKKRAINSVSMRKKGSKYHSL